MHNVPSAAIHLVWATGCKCRTAVPQAEGLAMMGRRPTAIPAMIVASPVANARSAREPPDRIPVAPPALRNPISADDQRFFAARRGAQIGAASPFRPVSGRPLASATDASFRALADRHRQCGPTSTPGHATRKCRRTDGFCPSCRGGIPIHIAHIRRSSAWRRASVRREALPPAAPDAGATRPA